MGLVEIIGDKFRYVRRNDNYDYRAQLLKKSRIDSNRIFVVLSAGSGEGAGLASLYFDHSKNDWQEESRTTKVWPGFDGFEETASGELWIQGKTTGTVDRITPIIENRKLDFDKSTFHHYGAAEGLDSTRFYFIWQFNDKIEILEKNTTCLLYTSPSPRDRQKSRMPSSA